MRLRGASCIADRYCGLASESGRFVASWHHAMLKRCMPSCAVALRSSCTVTLRLSCAFACADSRSISALLLCRPGCPLGCRLKRYLSVVSCAISAASFPRGTKHQIERCFKHCPYVVPFAFPASPMSPLAPPLTTSLAPSLAPPQVSRLAPLRLSRRPFSVFERVINK